MAETVDDAGQSAGPETARASGFEIRWHSISGGGGAASSVSYQLRGTIGQHAASPDHPAESASFAHTGGFWAVMVDRAEAVLDRIFRDRFEP